MPTLQDCLLPASKLICPSSLLATLADVDDLDLQSVFKAYNVELPRQATFADDDQEVATMAEHAANSGNVDAPNASAVFFQLSCLTPWYVKSGYVDHAALMGSKDVVVQELRTHILDKATQTIMVSYQRCARKENQYIMNGDSLRSGIQSLRLWQAGAQEHYAVPGCTYDRIKVSHTVCALVACDAIADMNGGGRTFDVRSDDQEYLPTLRELEAQCFVVCVSQVRPIADIFSWQLCQETLDICEVSRSLVEPCAIMRYYRDVPVEEMTKLELVHRLESTSWSKAVHGLSKMVPFPVNVKSAAPKVFWVRQDGKGFTREYLQALVNLSSVVSEPSVLHFGTVAYYKSLYVKKKRESTLNITDDDGLSEVQAQLDVKKAVPKGGVVDATTIHEQTLKRTRPKGMATHDKTYPWAGGLITYVMADGVGVAWQATCPLAAYDHMNPDKPTTKCKKRIGFKGDADERTTALRLQHWINRCSDYDNRLTHMGTKSDIPRCLLEPLPPLEDIIKQGEDLVANLGSDKPAVLVKRRRINKKTPSAIDEDLSLELFGEATAPVAEVAEAASSASSSSSSSSSTSDTSDSD
jgi:hypothetical protein